MSVFAPAELDLMRGAQEAAMPDTCQIGHYRAFEDDYNAPRAEYQWGGYLSCGVEELDPDEVQDEGEVVVIDAVVRLPIDTDIESRDRVRVTYRHGEMLDVARTFEVVGPPQRGLSGLVVNCRVVNDGTE